jgi:hypothetical protein
VLGAGWFTLSQTKFGQALFRVYVPFLATSSPESTDAVDPLPEFAFSVETGPLPWIEPGTPIDVKESTDWTDLVIRNGLKITEGESGENREQWNQRLAGFSLGVLARVTPFEADSEYAGLYGLDHVAMGWFREIDGQWIVISSKTQMDLGADLSSFEALMLAMQEIECDATVSVVARSATALIYDVQRFFAFGDQHVEGILRHAVLVDPRTGELAVFMWRVPLEEVSRAHESPIHLLPESLVTDMHLRLTPGKGGALSFSSAKDFAIVEVPPGREEFPVEGELATIAYAPRITPKSARELDRRLRATLDWK